jgi:hypothetical protein
MDKNVITSAHGDQVASQGSMLMNTQSTIPSPGKLTARERFQALAAEWKGKSRHMSNVAQMALLQPYQRIIGMGQEAVPFLLEELRREPDQWFWALEAITQENPVPPEAAGKVRLMAETWIEWGKKHGYSIS